MAGPAPRPRKWRRAILIAMVAVAAWWSAGLAGALVVTRSRHTHIVAREAIADHPVEAAATRSDDGLQLRGWLVPASPHATHAVVLAAGIGGNRLAMGSRAPFYLERGWSVLLVDLRATGASDGDRVSMGWHEAADLHAWRDWLQRRGYAAIGAHGQSLGAAAITYSDGDWAFAVLESCYADIDEAMAARLPWLPIPRVCLWPLRCCCEWLLGVDANRLRPVAAITDQHCPTLLLCGDADTKVGVDAGQRLLRACPAADKHFVPIAGAGHVDLVAVAGEALQQALAVFVPRAR